MAAPPPASSDFIPQFKLILTCNRLPKLSDSNDRAIWRRSPPMLGGKLIILNNNFCSCDYDGEIEDKSNCKIHQNENIMKNDNEMD